MQKSILVGTWAILVAGVVVVAPGCGGNDRAPTIEPSIPNGNQPGTGSGGNVGTGGTESNGGTGNGGVPTQTSGGTGNGGAPSALSPSVEVISPDALENPADGAPITTATIDTVCRARPGTDPEALPINDASVEIALLDSAGTELTALGATPTGDADEFGVTLTLPADYPNGPLTVRCTASDTSEPPLTVSGNIDTLVDKGPTIEVVSPLPDSSHALSTAVHFEFDVLPAPLGDDDPEAAVDTVTLTVNGVVFAVTDSGGTGTFSTNVDFGDTTLFPETPAGAVPVLIETTNGRGIRRARNYLFIIDGEGPDITVTSPVHSAIVGTEVVLEFTVADSLTAVDPSTVFVNVNGTDFQYDPDGEWSIDGDSYSYRFDTTQYDTTVAQFTINISAVDEVGNVSPVASHLLYLDFVAPVISLDPPTLRTYKTDPTLGTQCSDPFDPLGVTTPGDGDTVLAAADFRAFVWERTNAAPGQSVVWLSGVDAPTVVIHLQGNQSDPAILVDESGDGTCDAISPATTVEPLNLVAVATAGAPYYGNDVAGEPWDSGLCAVPATPRPADTRTPICPAAPSVRYVPSQRYVDGTAGSAIYVVPLATGGTCFGRDWQIDGFPISEGWLCLAASVSDKVGNSSVSAPLRVCFDADASDSIDPCASIPPPTCTDGCTPPGSLPAGFDRIIKE